MSSRHDEDLREPLVRCQGSQVSMRVARGSAFPEYSTQVDLQLYKIADPKAHPPSASSVDQLLIQKWQRRDEETNTDAIRDSIMLEP